MGAIEGYTPGLHANESSQIQNILNQISEKIQLQIKHTLDHNETRHEENAFVREQKEEDADLVEKARQASEAANSTHATAETKENNAKQALRTASEEEVKALTEKELK